MNPSPLFYDAEHVVFRDQVRRFAETEVAPNAHAWDEAGEVPRALYRKAAEIGILGLRFDEAYGGVPADRFYAVILQQELARGGSGGTVAALLSHSIAMPPLAEAGSEELKRRVLVPVLAGEAIAALACTEPTGGSDVGATRTTARLDGDGHYIVNGEKTFISSGMRADYFTTVVRTGGPGTAGLSLLLIDGDAPGLSRYPLHKTGWLASDTATLHFDNVRVPIENLIGVENQGFGLLTRNFNDERLGLAASSIAFARLAYENALEWARMRVTFGKPIFEHQVVRHKLVDMYQRVVASQAMLECTTWQMEKGLPMIAELCALKNQATQTLAFCATEAVQILGGAGFLRGGPVERIYREVKVNAIGGGSEEIMKELAARHLT